MYQIVGIVIRVAAIFILLNVLAFITRETIWVSEVEQLDAIVIIALCVYITVPLLAAILLWRFPLSIAKKIVPEIGEGDKLHELPLDQIQAAALAVVGIAIIALNLSDLLYWYVYLRESAMEQTGEKIGASAYASLYATFLELALGIWLTFGGRGIIGLIRTARYAGTEK